MQQSGKRSYHHGDLRQALLDAALAIVSARGLSSLTLREVARQAGVSHNAPYHHFADKAELVVALTVDGFQTLERALRSAYEQTEGTAMARTLAIGGAYLRFALDNPAVFRLLFRPELRQSSRDGGGWDETVEHAADATVQVLLRGIDAAQQVGALRTETPVEILALTLWSTMHGLTVLLLDNLLVDKKSAVPDAAPSSENAEQLMAQVMQLVLQGLRHPSA